MFDDPITGTMWKQSVKDINGDVLCVSQFTLLADTRKGNKPDVHRAMVNFLRRSQLLSTRLMSLALQGSEKSRETYALFLERMGKLYKPEKIKGQ